MCVCVLVCVCLKTYFCFQQAIKNLKTWQRVRCQNLNWDVYNTVLTLNLQTLKPLFVVLF